MASTTPVVRTTRSATGGKPKAGPKPQSRRKETPKAKTSARAAKNTTQKEMREFMEQQAKINETILQQLQSIGTQSKDKCGRDSVLGTKPQVDSSGGRGLGVKGKQPDVEDIIIPSPSTGSSESDENGSDYEALARDDMTEANELLKPISRIQQVGQKVLNVLRMI